MACGGRHFTAIVTDQGDVFSWGKGDSGQLGLTPGVKQGSSSDNQLLPAWVGGCKFFGSNIVFLAAGESHAAGVVADGGLFTWGNGAQGRLGVSLPRTLTRTHTRTHTHTHTHTRTRTRTHTNTGHTHFLTQSLALSHTQGTATKSRGSGLHGWKFRCLADGQRLW